MANLKPMQCVHKRCRAGHCFKHASSTQIAQTSRLTENVDLRGLGRMSAIFVHCQAQRECPLRKYLPRTRQNDYYITSSQVNGKAVVSSQVIINVVTSSALSLSEAECKFAWPSTLVKSGPEPLLGPVALGGAKPDERTGPRPVTEARLMVLIPMTRSEVPREIRFPDIVMAELPWKTSVPSIASPFGYAVNVSPTMVKTDGPGTVDVPMLNEDDGLRE